MRCIPAGKLWHWERLNGNVLNVQGNCLYSHEEEEDIVHTSRPRRAPRIDVTNLNAFLKHYQTIRYGLTPLKKEADAEYPSWKVVALGEVERKRTRRPRKLPVQSPEVLESVQVVLFKKPKPIALLGLHVNTITAFFNNIFVHSAIRTNETTGVAIKQLVNNNLSMVPLITSQEANGQHTILAGVIFNIDDKQGIFVPYVGVLDSCLLYTSDAADE